MQDWSVILTCHCESLGCPLLHEMQLSSLGPETDPGGIWNLGIPLCVFSFGTLTSGGQWQLK
ncbi:hypothetical protein BX600DRAFT_476894 [Xylariales sp. PMI_506]|nr:hypothetical protein BX600DRAFT_476894 [Xylariales sp. PMI_506]